MPSLKSASSTTTEPHRRSLQHPLTSISYNDKPLEGQPLHAIDAFVP